MRTTVGGGAGVPWEALISAAHFLSDLPVACWAHLGNLAGGGSSSLRVSPDSVARSF